MSVAPHPYAKLARFVRKRLLAERRWRRRPTYGWVLYMVKRNIGAIECETKTARQTQQRLLDHIRPVAAFVHETEGRWRVPESDLG